MDHVNVNRISLAALGSVLFVMLLVAFSNLVISPRTPKVPGFALPTGEAAAPAAAPKAAPETPLPVLLAKADAKKGEQDAKVCETCHNFKEGEGPKIGPDLWDVVGRPVASFPGFAYSDALKIGGDWTYESSTRGSPTRKRWPPGRRWRSPAKKTRISGPTSWPICTRSPTSRSRSRSKARPRHIGRAPRTNLRAPTISVV